MRRLPKRAIRYLRFLRRHTHYHLMLEVALLICAGGLAMNSLSASTEVTVILGVLYFVVLVWKSVWAIKRSVARDVVRAEVLGGLVHFIDETIFGCDGKSRFTIFKQDPIDSDFIIPWYRYHADGDDSISAAEKSHARYRKGEGYTGRSWSEGSSNQFQIAVLPAFPTRADFEHFYVNKLKIDPETVKTISPYMECVGVILSCRFCDTLGKFLALLSIDLQRELVSTDPPVFNCAGGDPITLTSESLVAITMLLHNVLRSLAQAERR